MPRPRTGGAVERDGRLYARVTWRDPLTGKHRARERRVKSAEELPRLIRQLENELELGGQEMVDGAKMTFRYVAEKYAVEHHKPAKIVGGRKVEGLRALDQPKQFLKTLVLHFGGMKIQAIRYVNLREFKQKRLATPTLRGEDRAIASVNRELEEMRKVLKFALQQGWIARNPFNDGRPLINKSDEVERMRILSVEEEARLLAQCVPPHRAHLHAFLAVAIDTFMRKSELFRLKKGDIDFEKRVINVRGTTTKTEKPRVIGLTQRAHGELYRAMQFQPDDALVFPMGSVKRSFATACRLAGLKDLRVHDLRHTGITRRLEAVVAARLPWQIVMQESGHTQFKTFMRYFNPDIRLLVSGAEAMGEMFRPTETDSLTNFAAAVEGITESAHTEMATLKKNNIYG
ncbi:MAG: tyrosine-type recombinase/integrase [Blastocatellia bacterium]